MAVSVCDCTDIWWVERKRMWRISSIFLKKKLKSEIHDNFPPMDSFLMEEQMFKLLEQCFVTSTLEQCAFIVESMSCCYL